MSSSLTVNGAHLQQGSQTSGNSAEVLEELSWPRMGEKAEGKKMDSPAK